MLYQAGSSHRAPSQVLRSGPFSVSWIQMKPDHSLVRTGAVRSSRVRLGVEDLGQGHELDLAAEAVAEPVPGTDEHAAFADTRVLDQPRAAMLVRTMDRSAAPDLGSKPRRQTRDVRPATCRAAIPAQASLPRKPLPRARSSVC